MPGEISVHLLLTQTGQQVMRGANAMLNKPRLATQTAGQAVPIPHGQGSPKPAHSGQGYGSSLRERQRFIFVATARFGTQIERGTTQDFERLEAFARKQGQRIESFGFATQRRKQGIDVSAWQGIQPALDAFSIGEGDRRIRAGGRGTFPGHVMSFGYRTE